MSQDKPTTRVRRVELSAGTALVLVTLLVYSSTFDFPFVKYDDPEYVFENPHVQSGLTAANIHWAFTTFTSSNWHPLTWLSLQLDAELFGGQNAGAFHRTNVVLHAANTLLLFLILSRLTGAVGPSAVTAGLFALHPLHVESVAWVTERKDVLSTLFGFLTLAAYLFYLKRPSLLRYLPLLLALGLGLLAKPMLVTLPCVLLLLDYWPLHRWRLGGFRPLLLEKMPLFILVFASCIVTFYAQFLGKSVATFETVPFTARLGNALLSYASYMGKMFWPAHLAVYYPHYGRSASSIQIVMAGLLLAAVTILVLGPGRRRPYLAVGWLWYLGTLVPVIGLVQVGTQGMADRYTYVPLIGLFLMLSWGAADLARRGRLPQPYLVASAFLVLSVCAVLSWIQVGCWQSSRRLWENAAAATENNRLAYFNLGMYYMEEGKIGDAKRAFEQAIAIDPRDAGSHANLGNVFGVLGLWEQAAAEYRTAIALDPSFASYPFNLGNALAQLGQREQAVAEYRRALALDPNEAAPHLNLGIQLSCLGRLDEAESQFRAALELDPASASAHSNLSILLVELGRHEEALAEARRAAALDAKDSRFHMQLAAILQDEGWLDEALVEYHMAWERGDRQVWPQLQLCERLRALQPRLAGLIAGRDQPADNNERLGFALLLSQRQRRRYALAARLYRETFRVQPQLAEDRRSAYRFQAAAAAAAAGCGQDAAPLDEQQKADLRHQSLEWLQAELPFWASLAQSDRPAVRAAAGRMLRTWRRDARFAGVREPALLAQRPQAERQAWHKLWKEIAATVAQADSPTRTPRGETIHE